MFATIAMLLIAVSIQDVASAQGAPKYPANQPVECLNAKVPSYKRHAYNIGANAFTCWPLSAVYDDASKVQMRSQRQRAPNENSFITQELNLEGYPRAR
jgi:hypothetical protein